MSIVRQKVPNPCRGGLCGVKFQERHLAERSFAHMKDITSEQIETRMAVWQQVREDIYQCMKRASDALFNLTDALLSESQATSLAELSLSPRFERKWPSVYEALEDGSLDLEKLR